ISRRCMGYGIMHMQKVQLFVFDYIDHLAGQGQLIRHVIKKRITLDVNFVIEKILTKKIQSGRLPVGDKMNLMPLPRKGFAQFSSYYPAPTKSRITDNSDFHMPRT